MSVEKAAGLIELASSNALDEAARRTHSLATLATVGIMSVLLLLHHAVNSFFFFLEVMCVSDGADSLPTACAHMDDPSSSVRRGRGGRGGRGRCARGAIQGGDACSSTTGSAAEDCHGMRFSLEGNVHMSTCSSTPAESLSCAAALEPIPGNGPLRPNFGGTGKRTAVVANYTAIHIESNAMLVHQYSVTFEPALHVAAHRRAAILEVSGAKWGSDVQAGLNALNLASL